MAALRRRAGKPVAHEASQGDVSASGIVRMYPNHRLGHPQSPVGPDHDFRLDEPYLTAAAAVRGGADSPRGELDAAPLWTAPYADPASGRRLITACAPVLDVQGQLRAVAGLDMEFDLLDAAPPSTPAGAYSFLVDAGGNVVGATGDALNDLGLAELVADARGEVIPGTVGGLDLARPAVTGGVADRF